MKGSFAGTLPIVGSDVASEWDLLYKFLVWTSVAFFILVIGGMIVFALKWRHQADPKPKYIEESHITEAVMIAIPTALLALIFVWGYMVYSHMVTSPSDAYQVRVIGKQWLWQFQYDDGRTFTNELYVPMGKPVKLVMTSEDVLHSFFIPSFRVKQDVVPGRYTSVWFEAKVPGAHQVFCAEYCGTTHSGMLAKVNVLTEEQWKGFLMGKKMPVFPQAGTTTIPTEAPGSISLQSSNAQNSDAVTVVQSAVQTQVSLAAHGKDVFEAKGCVSCHSSGAPDGSTSRVGPTIKGLYGSKVKLSNGKQVVADENYLRESIENPQAKLVQGFGPVMPTFKGLISETEMNALMSYLKSLQ